MTKIKLCGLKSFNDIEAANELMPEYIGFVFAPKSRRYVSFEKATELKRQLHPNITAVGVFVNEAPETVAKLLNSGVIDAAQLHGKEDEAYIRRLRSNTDKMIIKAFRIDTESDVTAVQDSTADYVLLDSGSGGTGQRFDWTFILRLKRQFFLAGGLDTENVRSAVDKLSPYAVDVSSGIETDGIKDRIKMRRFVKAVRDHSPVDIIDRPEHRFDLQNKK